MTLLCRRCLKPHGGDGRRKYCLPCRATIGRGERSRWGRSPAGRAAKKRYRLSPKGRAATRRYRSSARGKTTAGLSYLRRRDTRLEQMRRYHAEVTRPRERAKYPLARICAAILCGNTFMVGPRQHHKLYCDECIVAFYGPYRLRSRAA